MKNTDNQSSTLVSELWFWFHLAMVLGAWVAPFFINWQLISLVYLGVVLQFVFFKKCFVNDFHGLDLSDDHNFYSELFEKMGIRHDRSLVKKIVRRYLYIFLMLVAIVWQVVLGNEPLWF